MQTLKKEVLSSDDEHLLQGVVYLPDGQPRGLFQVVHGMCEYIGRYDWFMSRLAEQGYIAFGYDHLGHGHTARGPEEWGYIADNDGWLRLIDDVSLFAVEMKETYGPLPYYLFGHSMGSFIVRGAVEAGARPERLIVCGTGGPNPASDAGLVLCRLIKAQRGGHHVSGRILNMAFGSYNKRFSDEHDPSAWLTKDLSVRDRYRNDPLCNFPFTVSAMKDLVQLQSRCNRPAAFTVFPHDLPTLLVSGTDDPVGDYGKGVRKVYQKLQAAGCQVEMKLYEKCRHEILNDTCREEVLRDILAFIK